MELPDQYRVYPCDDYFASFLSKTGLWDDDAQVWLIEPFQKIEEEIEAEFLQVGRPGVDSIGFGYRKGHPGFWAYHRMVDQEFQYLAATVTEFLDGWYGGRISI